MDQIREVVCAPISAHPKSPMGAQVPGRCLFVGSKGEGNVHGLLWFLKEVWPKVLSGNPSSQLHVCGTVCDKIETSFPNTQFLGRVDSLDLEYAAAEVCLIPLHFGSGLKIKLIEALGYGRACVSTTIGIQGMAELKNTAVMVADTGERFATSIHHILSDSVRRRQMEAFAHQFATEKLSPEMTYQTLLNRIDAHLDAERKMVPRT
jgi:glycosyltransferase involved in cell wall biosynthesis